MLYQQGKKATSKDAEPCFPLHNPCPYVSLIISADLSNCMWGCVPSFALTKCTCAFSLLCDDCFLRIYSFFFQEYLYFLHFCNALLFFLKPSELLLQAISGGSSGEAKEAKPPQPNRRLIPLLIW